MPIFNSCNFCSSICCLWKFCIFSGVNKLAATPGAPKGLLKPGKLAGLGRLGIEGGLLVVAKAAKLGKNGP